MSVIHSIAWGLVDEDEVVRRFQYWRREVRRELRTHRFRLIPCNGGYYRLERRTKKGGHRRYATHAYGNFLICCQQASRLITPPNQETI